MGKECSDEIHGAVLVHLSQILPTTSKVLHLINHQGLTGNDLLDADL